MRRTRNILNPELIKSWDYLAQNKIDLNSLRHIEVSEDNLFELLDQTIAFFNDYEIHITKTWKEGIAHLHYYSIHEDKDDRLLTILASNLNRDKNQLRKELYNFLPEDGTTFQISMRAIVGNVDFHANIADRDWKIPDDFERLYFLQYYIGDDNLITGTSGDKVKRRIIIPLLMDTNHCIYPLEDGTCMKGSGTINWDLEDKSETNTRTKEFIE